jgi:hypothetical protein
MLTKAIRTAFIAAITVGAPAGANAAPAHPVAVEKVSKPAPAPTSASSQYADREASDKDVANFQGGMIESGPGGTVVVISGAALVALVLLILII